MLKEGPDEFEVGREEYQSDSLGCSSVPNLRLRVGQGDEDFADGVGHWRVQAFQSLGNRS